MVDVYWGDQKISAESVDIELSEKDDYRIDPLDLTKYKMSDSITITVEPILWMTEYINTPYTRPRLKKMLRSKVRKDYRDKLKMLFGDDYKHYL